MMASPTPPVTSPTGEPMSLSSRRNSLWWDAFYRFRTDKIGVISLFVILAYVGLALLSKFGFIFTEYATVNNANAYAGFSWAHPFGTDIFGRDILSRSAHATMTAITIGLTASTIALVIGVVLGSLAGYFGKRVDDFVTWLYTTVDSVPSILLIPSLAFVLGKGLVTVNIAVGVTSWVFICRLVRGEFLKHKQREYVLAAQALGASHKRRIFSHILPNVLHLAFVQFGLGFVTAIKFEVILSYLGLGVDVATPSWGIMINDAKQELMRPFWGNLIAATIFMFGLILAFNLFNDALRDALDPKLKNK